MQRWKCTIEYRGSEYYGWQRQLNVPSVQQAIEEAIEKFCQKKIVIHVAGRTDRGVHACGQVAHFDLDYGDRPIDGYILSKAINAHLRPQPISILSAEPVSQEFHARFHATNKLYRYRIVQRTGFMALEAGLVWHTRRKLDVEAMQQGAKYLLGHHDFSTFRDQECQAKSPIKTLDRLDVVAIPYDICGGQEIRIETEAQSFLHHQVRNMVGTLSLVGLGKWKPEDVKTALEAKDRKAGGPTGPSDGLYLMRVDYDASKA